MGFDGLKMPPSLKELIKDYFIGGVILYRRNIGSPKQVCELVSSIKDAGGDRKLLISIDCEGGRVFRLPPPFPQWGPLSEIKTPEESYERAREMAVVLRECGINLNFMPVLDVNTDIKNPIIGNRAFSNSANIVADLGVHFIRGLQKNGVIACGKHFPGHGDTFQDSHETLPRIPNTLGRLTALELVPFQAAISAGVKTIMTAHVIYEALDDEFPATISQKIIDGILRRRLKFEGVVITDDLLMKAVSNMMRLSSSTMLAINAGCDICLISRNNNAQKEAINALISNVSAGLISEERIESAYRRVVNLSPE